MPSNPYQVAVDAAQAKVNDLRAQIAAQVARRDAAEKRRDDWSPGFEWPPQAEEASQEYGAAASEIARLQPLLNEAIKQLEAAQKTLAEINRAAAFAVADGLTPDAALQSAVADRLKAEGTRNLLTYVGVGAALLIIAVALVYFIRKRRKK